MFKKIALSSAIVALAGFGSVANAAEATANVDVSLNVTAGCEIYVGEEGAATGTLAERAALTMNSVVLYGAGRISEDEVTGSTDTGAAGTGSVISVGCGNNGETALSPTLVLTSGANDVDSQKYLSNGTETIPYSLFSDASLTTPLGNGDQLALSIPAAGGSQAVAIYGEVPNPSTAITAAGSYTDTLTLTLTY